MNPYYFIMTSNKIIYFDNQFDSIIYQNKISLCKVHIKQFYKESRDKTCHLVPVKKSDGTTNLRSCPRKELDEKIDPIADYFCKRFFKDE